MKLGPITSLHVAVGDWLQWQPLSFDFIYTWEWRKAAQASTMKNRKIQTKNKINVIEMN